MLVQFTLLCFIALGCRQMGSSGVAGNASFLYQHWVHSYEEDDNAQGFKTYRPIARHLPPARGRDGFEIRKNGTCVSHPIGAADNRVSIRESWKLSAGILTITGISSIHSYRIVQLSKDILIVKPI